MIEYEKSNLHKILQREGKIQHMEKDNKRPVNTKPSLILRLIAGMYLVYLAYELIMGLNAEEGAPTALVIVAAIIFAVLGGILAIVSAKAFLKGDFQGGIKDNSEKIREND